MIEYLYFTSCEKITDIGLKSLASLISENAKNLLLLELDFSGQVTLKKSILYFIGRCKKLSDSGFTELYSKMGENLKSLASIQFNFSE